MESYYNEPIGPKLPSYEEYAGLNVWQFKRGDSPFRRPRIASSGEILQGGGISWDLRELADKKDTRFSFYTLAYFPQTESCIVIKVNRIWEAIKAFFRLIGDLFSFGKCTRDRKERASEAIRLAIPIHYERFHTEKPKEEAKKYNAKIQLGLAKFKRQYGIS